MQNFMHPWGRWVKFEYMRGSGMITGPAAFNETANMPPVLYEPSVYPGSSNTANGYYVGGGLFVTHRLEVDMRYDRYDLYCAPKQERQPQSPRLMLEIGLDVSHDGHAKSDLAQRCIVC